MQISRRLLFSFFHEKTRVFLVFSSIYQWAFHFFRKNQKLFLGTIITVSYSCKQNLNVDDFGYFDRKRKRFSEQYCLNTKFFFWKHKSFSKQYCLKRKTTKIQKNCFATLKFLKKRVFFMKTKKIIIIPLRSGSLFFQTIIENTNRHLTEADFFMY